MENDRKISVLPVASLVAVFSVANGLISAPDYEKSILPFLLASLFGVAAMSVTAVTSVKVLPHISARAKGILYPLLSLIPLILAVFAAREFCKFIYADVLVRESIYVIKAVFAFCVFALAVSNKSTAYKLSVLSLAFITLAFSMLFLFSVKTFDVKNLKDAFLISGFSLSETARYFVKMFLPTAVAVAFIINKRRAISAAALGTAYSALIFTMVIADCVLSFGLPLAAKLDYPYIDDISTVSVGSLFTRMDGFAYIAFFACYLLKCGVCINLAVSLLGRMGIKRKKLLCLLFSLALII